MKTTIATASAILTLIAGAATAQPWRGDTQPMRDGSTMVTVGGCLVQYGRRNERINNAVRCSDSDIREADRIMSGGGGRPGYGGDRPGYGGDRPGFGGGPGGGMPGGSWRDSCRGGEMRGNIFRTECRTSDGRWNATILDMRNCPTNYAENRNGSLVCR